MSSRFDSEATLREARGRLPFEQLLQQHGHAPQNGRYKSFTCPFCTKKQKAGLFVARNSGQKLFKCQSTACAGNKAQDEVGYLALVTGRTRGDAFVDYLKMAGVWEERERYQKPEESPTVPHGVEGETSPAAAPVEAPGLPDTEPEPENARPSVSDIALEYGLIDDEVVAPVVSQNEDAESDGGLEPIRAFYDRLALSAADEEIIFRKRGIGTTDARRLGFRSNLRGNLPFLQEMHASFPAETLIESGLWIRRNGKPEPNKQFYGFGLAGKNHETGDDLWDWTNPILIPYFDSDGKLVHLRPHKGGAKGKPPRLYVPRLGGEVAREAFEKVMITEGEFKAAAIWCRAQGRIGIASMPGITMANNFVCREELREWLKIVGAKKVVVVYDNEEKSDPNLPSFQPNKEKRYDSEIWARLLARQIGEKMKISATAGRLPNEWRDEKGKADWDGALSRMTAASM